MRTIDILDKSLTREQIMEGARLAAENGLQLHLTMMVGYDPRFSRGDYGIWVECAPERFASAEALLRKHGAVEVRGER